MKANLLDIKSETLAAFHVQLFGGIMIFLTLYLLVAAPWFAIISFLIGGAILSGFSGIQFDRNESKYREYYSFFFLKFGKWKEYNQAVKLYINMGKVSQKVYTQVTTGSTYQNTHYNAYLKFDDETKLFLTYRRNKEKLNVKLKEVEEYFALKIIDNSHD